jgi:hypothetical protein
LAGLLPETYNLSGTGLFFNNIRLQTLLSSQLFVVGFGIRCSVSGFGQLFDFLCPLSKMYHHILSFLQAKAKILISSRQK